jgi:hypothetical protein
MSEFVDMSEEAKEKRRKENQRIKALAHKAWEDMNNEGNNVEKEYWIHGFCIGYNYEKD